MNRFSSHDRAIGQDGRCWRLPQQSNTTLFGPLDHPLVQNRPPDTDAALTVNSASAKMDPSMKRMRRKICPSPVGMWMPSSRRAASVNSRSPQALSIGGSAPSATVTEKPFFRAAIRQPRRTASYDQDIRRISHGSSVRHREKTWLDLAHLDEM